MSASCSCGKHTMEVNGNSYIDTGVCVNGFWIIVCYLLGFFSECIEGFSHLTKILHYRLYLTLTALDIYLGVRKLKWSHTCTFIIIIIFGKVFKCKCQIVYLVYIACLEAFFHTILICFSNPVFRIYCLDCHFASAKIILFVQMDFSVWYVVYIWC